MALSILHKRLPRQGLEGRWPRPRFTLRRLMLAVAAAGLLVEAGVLGRRHFEYRDLAIRNGEKAQREQDRIDWTRKMLGQSCYAQPGLLSDSVERLQTRADHFDSLRRKYEASARRPWLIASADPPEPK